MQGITRTLLFSLAAAGVGSPFLYGYNLGIINAPQTIIGLWIREIKCSRLNASRVVAANESALWCAELSEKQKETIFDTNQELDSIWILVAAVFCIGGLVAAWCSRYAVKRYGPRKVLLANSITGLAASLTLSLSYVAFSYELLIVGRLIAGFHAGISSAVGPMYMTEIPPKDVRGIFGGSYECFHVLAILISEVLGHPSVLGTATLWPYLFALGAVPCILQLATLPFCPESPKYLYLAKNQPDKAKEALKRLRGSSPFDEEWEQMRQEHEDMDGKDSSVLNLFRHTSLRLATVISMVIISSKQLTGHDAVIYYSTQIFKAAGLPGSNAEAATVGVGGVLLVTTVVTTLFMERIGRRMLLLFGLASMCVVTCLLTVFMVLFENAQSGNGTENIANGYGWTPYASMVCIFLHVITFSIGPGTVPAFLVQEMFGQSNRPAATSVALAINWISELLVVGTFPLIQEHLKGYTFAIFAGFIVFYFVYTIIWLPETKGKDPESIADELGKK